MIEIFGFRKKRGTTEYSEEKLRFEKTSFRQSSHVTRVGGSRRRCKKKLNNKFNPKIEEELRY